MDDQHSSALQPPSMLKRQKSMANTADYAKRRGTTFRQTPQTRELTRQDKKNGFTLAKVGKRGHVHFKCDATYLGMECTPLPTGNDQCKAAIGALNKKKLKLPSILTVTDLGIYIDLKEGDKSLLKKVEIDDLTFIAMDKKNKKLVSFICTNASIERNECHAFVVTKGHPKEFPAACKKVLEKKRNQCSRAEAEAALIAAATPIMPAGEYANVAAEIYEQNRDLYSGVDEVSDWDQQGQSLYSGTRKPRGQHGPAVMLHPDDEGMVDLDIPWLAEGTFDDAIAIFKAYYIGSCPVREISGSHVCADAVKRVRKMRLEPRDVSIIVSPGSISLVERYTGDFLQHAAISEVTYTVLDARDNRNFSYISVDNRAGFAYCHILKIYADGPKLPPAVGKARAMAGLPAFQDEVAQAVAQNTTKGGTSALSLVGAKSMMGMFEATYLGSVAVDSERDNLTIFEGMWRLRSKFLTQASLPEDDEGDWTELGGEHVALMINDEGVRIVEFLTGETLDFNFIQTISFFTSVSSTLDETDPHHDVFAYITINEQLGLLTAHLFKTAPHQARQICKTISLALKNTRDDGKANNPFKATGTSKQGKSSDEEITKLFGEQIDRCTLEMVRALGSGQFGVVYLAEHTFKDKRGNGMICIERAVKVLKEDTNERDQEDFLREALIMAKLNHGNLVRYIGVSVDHYPWLLVLEFVKYGDLRSVTKACLEYGMELTTKETMNWGRQLADGMAYLSAQRLVHMDLAARNVLLNINSIVKVSDFGLTKNYDEGKMHYRVKANTTVKLPVKWMAIECFEGLRFSQSSDVWAYGVTMWEVLTYGEVPYSDVPNARIRKEIKGGLRLAKPEGCNDELYSVLLECWTSKTDERLTFKDLHKRFSELMAPIEGKVRDIGLELKKLKDAGKPKRENKKWKKLKKKNQMAAGQENYLTLGDDADDASKEQDSYLEMDQPEEDEEDSYLEFDTVVKHSATTGEDVYVEVEQAFRQKGTGIETGVERCNPLFVDDDEGDDVYFDVSRTAEEYEEYKELQQESYMEMAQEDGAAAEAEESYFELEQDSYVELKQED